VKYCLSARQASSILSKTDEIKVDWKDRGVIIDYIKNYSDKIIILNIPKDVEEMDWNLFITYSETFKEFYLCFSHLKEEWIEVCKEFNIKFYWSYPVTSYFELDGLKKMGVSQMLIGMPLSFDLQKVKNITDNISLRLVANYSYEEYIPRINGIKGQYIRPEDIPIYGEYIDTIEFRTYGDDWITKEATLYHVYAENKNWPGNLNLLITNLNYDIDNKLLNTTPNFAEKRIKCG
jgi:hypothetical protein